ncbi:MAG: hypothetical protein Q7J84_11285 [Sulfuricaulis sp.]|nr:hypothetical protein [Sulfuricaulis sp.]
MENGLLTLLSLGLGLGLLHALDADHILAVSGSIGAHPGHAAGRRFCLRWMAGHGLVLLPIGAAVLWLGMVLPAAFNTYAEGLVGLALLVIAAVLIGVLHGAAGSAPLLALLPRARAGLAVGAWGWGLVFLYGVTGR